MGETSKNEVDVESSDDENSIEEKKDLPPAVSSLPSKSEKIIEIPEAKKEFEIKKETETTQIQPDKPQ